MSNLCQAGAARQRGVVLSRKSGEKWRPWPRLPGYLVSNKATPARAVRRLVGKRFRYLRANTSGPYPSISFYIDGARVPVRLHIIVAETWLPPKPHAGAMVLHRDDDTANCAVSNLRWGTRLDNLLDAARNGRNVKCLGLKTALFIRDTYPRRSASSSRGRPTKQPPSACRPPSAHGQTQKS